MNNRTIVTRFAPSPTGFMHVGGIRTALYAWAFARKHGGTFILRIEDTDKEREVAGSIIHIIESLKWLGIEWDEGPEVGGVHAPYIQSERLDLYKKYAELLIEKGYAYADPFTQEQVAAFREEAEKEGKPFLFRNYRPETTEKWDGTKPLRFKTPTIKSYAWHDEVRGDLSAGEEALDDFILIKSDGYPTYNFAHIVDDIEMGVTHVMRGEEFIASTPKFLSVYDALGVVPPKFVTLPPILGEGGNKKLSKRDGAKDVLEYRTEGYVPETLVNFLAFLGWNPGDEREVLTSEEFIAVFDIDRVGRSGAQWNDEKLDWLNKEHLKRMDTDAQHAFIESFLTTDVLDHVRYSTHLLEKLAPLIIERIHKGIDITAMCEEGELSYFLDAPTVSRDGLCFKDTAFEDAQTALAEIVNVLEPIESWDIATIKEAVMTYADTLPSRGVALHAMRFALSGKAKSPDPFTIASIIGKEDTITRLTTKYA